MVIFSSKNILLTLIYIYFGGWGKAREQVYKIQNAKHPGEGGGIKPPYGMSKMPIFDHPKQIII